MNRYWAGRSALMVASLLAPAVLGAQSYESQRVDTSLALERGGIVSVSAYSGRVNVTGTTGSNVRVQGGLDRGDLEIRGRSGSVRIAPDPARPQAGRVDLDISVPIGTRVVLEGFSVPFSVRGVKGEVKIETLSGNVVVSDAVGKVNVETVGGNIDISQVDGDVTAEAVSGRIEMTDIDGDIESESVSGRIMMNGAKSKSVRAETVSGSVTYNGTFDPTGNYVFKSHSGRLTMGLPANAGATVSLETFNGNVDTDFPVTLESGNSRNGHESRFEFRIGDGRSRIVAETFSGDIRIQRGTTVTDRE